MLKFWRKIKRSSNNVAFKWWCDFVSHRNDYDRMYLTYADLVLYSNSLFGVSFDQLAAFADVDAWIQVACPRLSIDWGHFFDKVRNA